MIMAALRSQSTSRASLSFIASACHQKRVSLGLHPVSLRKSKEMGWNGQGQRGLLPNKTAHTCKAKDKAASSLCFVRVRDVALVS